MNQEPSSKAAFGEPSAQPSEEPLSIHLPGPAVTRVNRRAVLLAAVFGSAMGMVVLLLGLGNHAPAKRRAAAQENAIRPTGPIESLRDLPKDYSFDVRQAAQGIGYASDTQPAASVTRGAAFSPREQALVAQVRQYEELRGKMLKQQRKTLDQALDSPLVFAGARASASRSSAREAGGTAARPVDGAASKANGSGAARSSATSGVRPQGDKQAFLTSAAAVEPYLTKPLLPPLSKYELKAGSIIPAALVTAINTDLPGQVIGQVTQNIYDSVTGNYLLIPQGSRLLGKYQSVVANGQNRVLLAWQRLIYPDGQSIVLDGMPAVDESGQAGVADAVDYHADKLVAATALTTALAYAGNLARNPQSSNSNSGSDVIGDTVAQQANRIGEKIIDKQLNVQPTITIRQGWPLCVLVNKDMLLAPYPPPSN